MNNKTSHGGFEKVCHVKSRKWAESYKNTSRKSQCVESTKNDVLQSILDNSNIFKISKCCMENSITKQL